MTSFAFILGVVPLMLAEGAGAEMRRTLGTAVFARHARRDAVRHLPDAGVLLRDPVVGGQTPARDARSRKAAGARDGAGACAVRDSV